MRYDTILSAGRWSEMPTGIEVLRGMIDDLFTTAADFRLHSTILAQRMKHIGI